MRLTLLFFISLLLFSTADGLAQDTTEVVQDSVRLKKRDNKYGLRVGLDLAKPLRTALEDGYTGFEITADFRVSKRFYAALELGTEEKERNEENLNSVARGSYFKIGADFNAYDNWPGLNNSIFAGLRYGFATFKQELVSYGIYTTDQSLQEFELRDNPQTFEGLNASWVELIVGVKTELFNNLFLSLNVQLKNRISETKPENFDNLYIPGFNRTYDESKFGVGYGYTISYLIPIFKR
ncbi:DUF6048 family protein [Gilvibacter sediminis]|uniref:DUF6048 family protein n=1 Tax=Gilvibacter sediminis TaxID=379071 RepID=UPI002350B263|nr:DUF6048 family protein [Gilvibacter sediminis]MDC7997802.1 DUF6048 family protein [Gilvibacter sediminis]